MEEEICKLKVQIGKLEERLEAAAKALSLAEKTSAANVKANLAIVLTIITLAVSIGIQFLPHVPVH